MIHIIINPAAGQDTPVLSTINSVFGPANQAWSVSVTLNEGDAKRQAVEAVADGATIVAVYGGDGTVVEAASGLLDHDVPLAILPGGTANVVAQEVGIPLDLVQACELIVGQHNIKAIDMGEVNDRHFLLRVGIGAEAKITEGADRELKDRLGYLAYVWSAAQNLVDVEQSTYHFTVDGESFEMIGVTCGIVNSGHMGLGNLHIVPNIYMDDGLLDLILVQNADLPAWTELIGNVFGLGGAAAGQNIEPTKVSTPQQFTGAIKRWTGKEIVVRVDPPQSVQYDGELLGVDEVHCRILPKALRLVVP